MSNVSPSVVTIMHCALGRTLMVPVAMDAVGRDGQTAYDSGLLVVVVRRLDASGVLLQFLGERSGLLGGERHPVGVRGEGL